LKLKEFSTEGVETVDNEPVEPTQYYKISTAIFFLIHYGGFHLFFLAFLILEFKPAFDKQIAIFVALFLIYQCFSSFYNKKWVTTGKPNIGTMFLFPYARIVPMLLTIVVGASLNPNHEGKDVLALFIALKILADVIMHIVENICFDDSLVVTPSLSLDK
jgi:hypothetical protein